jgi:hypothetical protein
MLKMRQLLILLAIQIESFYYPEGYPTRHPVNNEIARISAPPPGVYRYSYSPEAAFFGDNR